MSLGEQFTILFSKSAAHKRTAVRLSGGEEKNSCPVIEEKEGRGRAKNGGLKLP